jgi:hypothetical protein
VIFRPFDRLSTGASLAVAAGGGFVALLVAWGLDVRFDGVLDAHLASRVDLLQALVDLAVAWPLLAAAMWLGGRSLRSRGRLVDYLGAVGLARWPLVLSALILALLIDRPARDALAAMQLPSPGILLLLVLVTIPLVVWFVALLYQGYRTASGLRGGRLVASFIVVLVVAEVVSKLTLGALTG